MIFTVGGPQAYLIMGSLRPVVEDSTLKLYGTPSLAEGFLTTRMTPTTTVSDAKKDLPSNHTPTFVKEQKRVL